jgi:hypothetical protein
MTTNKITSKKTTASKAQALEVGMKKRFPNGSQTITVGGTVISVDGAVANLQAIVDNRAAVTTAKAAAKVNVANENAKLPPLLAFMQALVSFIRGTFGSDASALADFDLEPHKHRTPMTAEEKAIAAAKRKATREARGEVGAKKRQAIKGHVTAELVVTPVTPAETPAAPAAPAAPTAPAPEPAVAAPPPAAATPTTPTKA